MAKRHYGFEARFNFSISMSESLYRRVMDFAVMHHMHRSGAICFLVNQGLVRILELEAREKEKEEGREERIENVKREE